MIWCWAVLSAAVAADGTEAPPHEDYTTTADKDTTTTNVYCTPEHEMRYQMLMQCLCVSGPYKAL